MSNYTKTRINVITFIISIIIFIFINLIFQVVQIQTESYQVEQNPESESKVTENEEKNEDQEKVDFAEEIEKISEWSIKIPAINLKATISEGTSKEVLDEYVGHFDETPKLIGNIGLAAHNRGYPLNYFQNLKKLNKGDEIYYKYNGEEKVYSIDKIKIIKDTDWSYLENTEENKITLITCVEDAPAYRRCVQGIEKGGN